MKLFLIFCSLFSFLNSGCSTCPDYQELIGNYSFVSTYNHYVDSISIKSDGTYKHHFYSSTGRVYESKGEWKFNSAGCEILFYKFVFFNDSGTDGYPPGNWYSKVNKQGGSIRLMYSTENNIYYEKNSQK